MSARLTKDFTFEAAQTLPKAPEGHKCRRVHGHSFKVEVSVEGDVDPATGWIYDHAEISAAMKPLLKILDHAYLNDIEGLENPTIENMAEWFWKKLEPQCPGLCEIVVHETPTARCIYRGVIRSNGWTRRRLLVNLQLNRVALHLVVKGGSLDPEQFGCFFLVPAAFGERLENCVPLQVIERLHAFARQPAEFGLLQRRRQLYFCRQLFNANHALLAPAPPHIRWRFAIREHFPATNNRATSEMHPVKRPAPVCRVVEKIA